MRTIANVPTYRENIILEDFFEIDPHSTQRFEEGRFKKAKHIREIFTPALLQIAIAEYPDGRRTCIDGNTRKWIWKNRSAKIKYEPPQELDALIYKVETWDEAEIFYGTYDSAPATKKTSDIITGAYRKNGLIDSRGNSVLKTSRFQNATGFKTVLTSLIKHQPEFSDMKGKKLQPHSYSEIIRHYKYQLIALDEIFDRVGRKSQKFHAHQISVCLMFLRKYMSGSKEQLLIKGIENLISGRKMAFSRGDAIDGITYILEYWSNGIYESNHAKIEKGYVMDKLIYFMQLWMDDKYRKQFSPKRGSGGTWYTDFWNIERR